MLIRFIKLFITLTAFVMLVSEANAQKAFDPADIPVKAFAQLQTTSGMKLSPDGTHLAFYVPFKGRQAIMISPLVRMEDGDHNLDTEDSRTTELTAMEKFLKKHIGHSN